MARDSLSLDQVTAAQSRGERLIVGGRAVLAASSLLAIWLDPASPGQHARIAYTLLSGYLVYALLLVPLAWRAPLLMSRFGLLTHGVDLGAFTLFMYFTEGPTSPFFVYFVFSVLSGAVRWQWRGALWSGIAATIVFVGMGVYVGYGLQEPAFELDRFIIRGVYLVLVTTLLVYLTAYEQGLRRELTRIAEWPRGLPQGIESLARQELEQASRLLGTSRMLMAWEDPEEPWTYLAYMDGKELVLERQSPPDDGSLTAPELAETHFYCTDLSAKPPQATLASPTHLRQWRGDPLKPGLADRFGAQSVLALRLSSEALDGWLLAFDLRGRAEGLLTLGEALVHMVQSDLDRFHLQQRLMEAVAAEQRVRLARDLHDGLLQAMTATGLQLETVLRLLDRDPVAARERLRELQALVAGEQADLRSFVHQLREPALRQASGEADFGRRLDELADRMTSHWGMRVALSRDGLSPGIGWVLRSEIYRIVQECLANAARHGGATEVQVGITSRGDGVSIEVADNGRGFTFRGRYDLAALNAAGIGPWSLRQRVAALGGELVVESGESGARIRIELPTVERPSLIEEAS